jgi:probable HAF family extracellular repeat protein
VSGEHAFPHQFEGRFPFFWRDGSFEEWNLGGFGLSATAMNQDGQVVGEWKSGGGGIRGYTWKGGTATDLGGPSTSAADVNDRGLIVGWAYFQNLGIHAALWTPAPGAIP